MSKGSGFTSFDFQFPVCLPALVYKVLAFGWWKKKSSPSYASLVKCWTFPFTIYYFLFLCLILPFCQQECVKATPWWATLNAPSVTWDFLFQVFLILLDSGGIQGPGGAWDVWPSFCQLLNWNSTKEFFFFRVEGVFFCLFVFLKKDVGCVWTSCQLTSVKLKNCSPVSIRWDCVVWVLFLSVL